MWSQKILRPVVAVLLAIFLLSSLSQYPGKNNLGYNLTYMKKVAMSITSRLQPNEFYDILVFSPSHDYQGTNYRYFLTTMGYTPADEENVGNFKTLFIIDEEHQEDLLKVAREQYKMSIWPNTTIVEDYTIPDGPRIIKLTR
jgi:hypothetical protein